MVQGWNYPLDICGHEDNNADGHVSLFLYNSSQAHTVLWAQGVHFHHSTIQEYSLDSQ